MSRIRRRILLLLAAAVMAATMVAGPAASVALADSPHKWKGGPPKWSGGDDSGAKFKPNGDVGDNKNDHPHTPGPH